VLYKIKYFKQQMIVLHSSRLFNAGVSACACNKLITSHRRLGHLVWITVVRRILLVVFNML